MNRYLYRVVDCDSQPYAVYGANPEPLLYWDDECIEPYGPVIPLKHTLEDADREHPSGAPHRWQRLPAVAWEEMPT